MKLKQQIQAPKGFKMDTVKLKNGINLIVARSDKLYNSPKVWNGNRWITSPCKC